MFYKLQFGSEFYIGRPHGGDTAPTAAKVDACFQALMKTKHAFDDIPPKLQLYRPESESVAGILCIAIEKFDFCALLTCWVRGGGTRTEFCVSV